MKNRIKKACAICGAKNFIFIDRIRVPFEFSIYQCNTCGVMIQFPLPSNQKLKQMYEKIYLSDKSDTSTENAFKTFNKKQEIGRMREISKFIKKGKLLDVGASSGFFVKVALGSKNWRAEGVELSSSGVKEAKRNNVRIMHGDIFNTMIKDNTYDVITMHSVLEHIPNPDMYVKELREKLKKKGYFVFNVPNTRSFEYVLYRLLKKKFSGFIFEHLYYYSPKSISLLLEKEGFTIKKITSRNYSSISIPSRRPLIGWLTFMPKLFLEHTNIGGRLNLGNILYVYAQKK